MTFKSLRSVDGDGTEYWLARELMALLECATGGKSKRVVQQATMVIANAGVGSRAGQRGDARPQGRPCARLGGAARGSFGARLCTGGSRRSSRGLGESPASDHFVGAGKMVARCSSAERAAGAVFCATPSICTSCVSWPNTRATTSSTKPTARSRSRSAAPDWAAVAHGAFYRCLRTRQLATVMKLCTVHLLRCRQNGDNRGEGCRHEDH